MMLDAVLKEKKIPTRDGYGRALHAAGKKNKNVVVLIADLGNSTKVRAFQKEFPDRFFDFGIAEANMICTAAGFATCGKIPFCSTFAIFGTGLTYNQIRQSVCYPELNVKIALTHAGLTVGEDGATHQANEDIAMMRGLPHMTVIVPADAVETEKAVHAAAEHKGPVYIRLGREAVPVLYGNGIPEDHPFVIGKSIQLAEGKDVTLAACGVMVKMAVAAAEALKTEGISARVLNMHTIKPIDREAIISAARETKAIVTAEEHSVIGGLGGAVCEALAEECPAPVERVGVKDVFGESGKAWDVMKKFGLTPEGIVEAARKVVRRKC